MVKKIFITATMFTGLFSAAQVTVNVQLPPAGLIQKDQLWNLVVVNNNNGISETNIALDIKDAITGQTVLSAGSRSFSLGKGIKIISVKDVQPVQYNYLAAELSGTYLPLGSYIACYRMIGNTLKGPESLGDECVRLNINPLSPPMLTTPFDRAVLQTTYPQFSWIPPTPSDIFSTLHYDIAVAEILPGQSPAEAILYNTPVYNNQNLRVAYENYPSSFSKLKAQQQYAWQVTARNGTNFAAQTEIWSFEIQSPDSVKENVSDAGYLLLSRNSEATGVSSVSNNMIRIKYYSFDKTHDATLKFLFAGGKTVMEVKKKIFYGNNFIEIKLNNQFTSGSVYKIELTDEQKNIFSTRFSIQ